jgi:hypothetical protein
MDLYALAKYPDDSFQNATQAQGLVTSRMRTKTKWVRRLWWFMLAALLAALACALLGEQIAIVGGIALMFVFLIPAAFLLVYAPAIACPNCGRRMKKDWAIIESGRSGEFMVCPPCRLYLYTHRTLR